MTAINVHNPTARAIAFKKAFAIALPNEKAGPVTAYFDAKLGPNQAFEIDCPDILRRSRQRTRFLKGFVIIETPVQLNVVAVYTAAGSTRQIEALDIERVSPRRIAGRCPDLIVESIGKPTWNSANRRSVIRVSIKNIGGAKAGETIARVIDPTTPQPTGAPYNAIATTPELMPGQSAGITFYLPYWVYNPDVTLEVTADYKGQLRECNERNNVKVFKDIG